MSYRKHKSLDGEWHFQPDCPLWPQTDYLETQTPPSDDGERLCMQCVSLESTASRRTK